MNRVRTALVDDEHIVDGDPEPIVQLRDAGYPVDVVERHAAVSLKANDEDSGYQPLLIRTLRKPPEEADAVVDEIEVPICHCGDFVFRRMANLEEGETPADISPCKHWKAIDKTLRAMGDVDQQTLVGADNPVGK